jgi:hypothetical protein
VLAGERDLSVRVQQGAVVDSHRVGCGVFDDGAVHERAEVAQRGVVEIRGGDALRDGLGELGGNVVHVGQAVGECDRELAFARALGDARADRLREGELAA